MQPLFNEDVLCCCMLHAMCGAGAGVALDGVQVGISGGAFVGAGVRVAEISVQ